ncbi:acyltransferase [Bradyrhizobium sp. BR13661]|uniref:acyltransferase family protein n=1 Tax=Bradyrhizobium sp. BR13661 TaxID=2940622 RepID=UPI0024756981|nr:acyltransferase [Bradyrhizobium sp. BR13661]
MDCLRGISALAVVVWHWQHMWLLGTRDLIMSPSFVIDRASEPFYFLLKVAYDHGYLAVPMFFLISGFIFFHLYERKICEGTITGGHFFLLRFSRLYPLHFATLLLVAGLQLVFVNLTTQYFVYPANDPLHFVGSLGFVQLTNDQAAFNGPAWSLTIEIAMYALFFLFARFGLISGIAGALLAALIGLFFFTLNDSLAQGLIGFFGGGAIYRLYTRVMKSSHPRLWFLAALATTLVGWMYAIAVVYDASLGDALVNRLTFGRHLIPTLSVTAILFPMTVLTFSLHESLFDSKYLRLAWLGNISYSSYLLHFPIQLTIAVFFFLNYLSLEFIKSRALFVLFFAVLIALSAAAFKYFELPMQNSLRQLAKRPRRIGWAVKR